MKAKWTIRIIALCLMASVNVVAQNGKRRWNETRAIDGLAFSALILRDFLDEERKEREVYVLMDPTQVNESNLHFLFRAISEMFPKPESLRVWVDTDVEQLGPLATGHLETSSPSREKAREDAEDEKKGSLGKGSKKVFQMALYERTSKIEQFTYNPDYPKRGYRTVIIRGKED